jgi:hypothetical protein
LETAILVSQRTRAILQQGYSSQIATSAAHRKKLAEKVEAK